MRFSVVTPSYSQGRFIRATLESILSQEGDFTVESIVMDGGSTDETVGILKEIEREVHAGRFAGRNAGVSFAWTSRKDKGQSDAINQGLRRCTGDIIAYLNSDDIYLPGALQAVASHFQRHPDIQWTYGRCRIIDSDGTEVRRPITAWKNLAGFAYSYPSLLVLNYISQPATFWRRAVYEAVGDFAEDKHLAMDYEYWCRIGRRFSARPLHAYVAGFRVHGESKGGTSFQRQFDEAYRIAAAYTRNPFLLGLHRLHDRANVAAYKMLSR